MVDFNKLSDEEKENLKKMIREEDKERERKRKEQIQEYKNIVDETVR